MEERRFKVKGTRTARVDRSFSLSINIARFHWVEPHPQALLFRDLQAGSIRLVSQSPSAPASSGYDGRSFVQIPNTKLASNMYFRQARLLEPRTFLAFVRHLPILLCCDVALHCTCHLLNRSIRALAIRPVLGEIRLGLQNVQSTLDIFDQQKSCASTGLSSRGLRTLPLT